MNKIVSFGEILLRLKAPGFERLFQSASLEATFGGSEANVAALLSEFGEKASFVTIVPDNAVGEAVCADLRKYGVETKDIVRKNGRLGIYFLEAGACQRPSTVVYDRADSCISNAESEDFNWEKIFEGAELFHVSGITPALSEKARRVTIEGMKAAKKAGLSVSMDINYRSKLWNYGVNASDVIKEMVNYVDYLISNEEHIRICLGITVPGYDVTKEGLPDDYFVSLCDKVSAVYPQLKAITLTKRRTYSSDNNDFSAVLYDVEKKMFFVSTKYHIENIVDRVGAGDSFSGGLIYGFLNFDDKKQALEFATATACLKHTIPGDVAVLRKSEVEQLMKNGSGRIQR